MANRRELREAAVQFLYCADIEGTENAQTLYQTFWNIVLESDQLKLQKASAKALLHLNQGRSSRHVKLLERAEEARSIIKTVDKALPLRDLLEKMLETEGKWQACCDVISRLHKSQLDSAVQDLEEALDNLYTLNHVLLSLRKEWREKIQNLPQLRTALEGINAQIEALDRIGQRLLCVEEPEAFPEQRDISHLRESVERIAHYRSEVDTFVSGVLKHKKEIDEAISTTVENFRPERIDPVDRAAIRLATYEILFSPSVPNPVAINEAIEIVKRFGSSESARFTNGILDTIAKKLGNQ